MYLSMCLSVGPSLHLLSFNPCTFSFIFLSACNFVVILYAFVTCRRWPCNLKGRVEESKEACEKFEKEITLVQDFGRGIKSVLFYSLSRLTGCSQCTIILEVSRYSVDFSQYFCALNSIFKHMLYIVGS